MVASGHDVVVLWRRDLTKSENEAHAEIRYPTVLDALAKEGLSVRHHAFCEEEAASTESVLRSCAVAIVWIDPISGGRDRSIIDRVLRDAAAKGTLIYSHPDTIQKMGTKDVLYDTRFLSWSLDTDRYDDFDAFKARFPSQLAHGKPRVLKQHRGNGGNGVWKVQLLDTQGALADASTRLVRVQHAAPRDGTTEDIAVGQLFERMEPYFERTGHLIDQAFAPRVCEGLVRAYLVKDEVVGFARQYADGDDSGRDSVPQDRVFGIPAPKTMLDPQEPALSALRRNLETAWVPGLMEAVGVVFSQLPLLWDADFLFGPVDSTGRDTYVLCEINVSCVSPFPAAAPARLARTLALELSLAS